MSYHKDQSAILLLFTFVAGAFMQNALDNYIGNGCLSEHRMERYDGLITQIRYVLLT